MTAVEVQHNGVDREAVLRALNLNPRDPNTQALILICERYSLDPLLKHVVLIQGRPYVTRDGYLTIAHATRQLDGIEVVEEGEDKEHWWARVSVFRKDMSHPFTYKGRYPKQGSGNKQYGPEMAIKTAEVAALRRAFNVTGAGAADERWDTDDVHEAGASVPQAPALPAVELADQKTHDAIRDALVLLRKKDEKAANAVVKWWKEQQFPSIKNGDRLSVEQAKQVLLAIKDYAEDETTISEGPAAEGDYTHKFTGADDGGGDESAPEQPALEAVGPDAPLVSTKRVRH